MLRGTFRVPQRARPLQAALVARQADAAVSVTDTRFVAP